MSKSLINGIFEARSALRVNSRILNERYEACNSKGHRQVEDNYCTHCYRTIDKVLETDKIIGERSNMSFMQQPMDAPYLEELRSSEIKTIEMIQYMNGLKKIGRELKNASGLEILTESK